MFNRVTFSTLFGPAYSFVDLVIQLWIVFILIYVLLLKNCLDIFLWTCQRLKRITVRMLEILCVYNSFVWASFLKEIQKDFSEQIVLRLSNKQDTEDVESTIRTICQAQRNELLTENKNRKQYTCQSCRIMSDTLLQCKNANRTSYSSLYEVLKHNVSTQADSEIIDTEYSHAQTPTRRSVISIFEKDLDSADSFNNRLKSSNIKKKIALTCNFPSPSSTSFKFKKDSSFRSSSLNFDKNDHSSINQNNPRRSTEEYPDIPLESTTNVSKLPEIPHCQYNLESIRNIELQVSSDTCINSNVGTQTMTECGFVSPEFEKTVSSPMDQNCSRTFTEECRNIPLESIANISQQLEGSQNFEPMRNSEFQLSQDFGSPESPYYQTNLKPIRNQVFPDTCINSNSGTHTITECGLLNLEFEKTVSTRNQNDSKTVTDENPNTHLESIANISQLLESSQNLEAMRNSGFQLSQNFGSQDFCIKKNAGTQTVAEQESIYTEYSNVPIHSSFISIFGKELDSEASLNNRSKSSTSKKQIALKCNFSSPRCSTSFELNDSKSGSLSHENDKSDFLPMNQNDSRRLITDEYVDIPLESPTNVSQLLESPLCQLSLESIGNLRLQFSQDICIPKLSPEEKSLFKRGWNKLKLMKNVNKRFLELKNIKRKPNEVSPISQQYVNGEASTNISYQNKTKDINKEDSKVLGCCSFIFQTLKSKFIHQVDDVAVIYKKF